MPCVELGDGRLLDESNSTAWLLSPESMLGGGEKAAQAEVKHNYSLCLVLILTPQVVKWMSLADNEATPAACNWVYPIIGILEPTPAQVSNMENITVILTPGK